MCDIIISMSQSKPRTVVQCVALEEPCALEGKDSNI